MTTIKHPVGLPFLEALARLPQRVRTIGHTTTAEHRANARSGNGGTLYSRDTLTSAATTWAKRSPRLRAARWGVETLSDGRRAIVDLQAKPGAPVEFAEPLKGQAFATDATR